MKRYTNRAEAIRAEIHEPLAVCGEDPEGYDIDAIADRAISQISTLGANPNHPEDHWLNTAGFECRLTPGEFWSLCAQQERGE